jgi:hypothetical protein
MHNSAPRSAQRERGAPVIWRKCGRGGGRHRNWRIALLLRFGRFVPVASAAGKLATPSYPALALRRARGWIVSAPSRASGRGWRPIESLQLISRIEGPDPLMRRGEKRESKGRPQPLWTYLCRGWRVFRRPGAVALPKARLWRAANVLRSAFGEVRRRCGTRPCYRNRMCGPLPTRNSCRPLTSSSVAPARHRRP